MIALLRTYLRPYRGALVVVVVLQLVRAVANLYLPSLNADIINNGVVKGDTDYILRTGALMLGVTVILGVAAVAAVYFGSRTAMALGRDLRGAIFRKVESFAQSEVNAFGTPSLITRNTNDVLQVQTVVLMGLNMVLIAPMMVIGGVVMALREDVALSSLLVIVLPLMVVVIGLVFRRVLPLFRAIQAKVDRINLVMRETLAGVRVIRAFVRNDHEERRFDEANVDLTATSLAVNRTFALTIPVIMAIFNLSTVAVLWFGAARVDAGEMPIGNLIAFMSYLMLILGSVLMAMILVVMVPRAAASSERINAVLDTVPSVADPVAPRPAPPVRGVVELRDVTFAYPGAEEPVLKGVSFRAEPGETLAIVGGTGSGKTTLVNLIARFYDVTGGSVLVDGVDVREMVRMDLWKRIGVVPQRALLFSGTVASNLRYGDPDADEAHMWHALEVAQARDFVATMEGGLEAPIAQGGTNVSGGQRQRLAFARAIAKEPYIYLFDDSFSALDYATDARLRAALRRETREATVIIVAQRVGTVMGADRIVVLEQGAVAGIGTHEELLRTCETYREIVASQLTLEEAA